MAAELHTVSISTTRKECPLFPGGRSSQKHTPSIQTSESNRRGVLLIKATPGFIRRKASLNTTTVFKVESHENRGTMTIVKNDHSIGLALINPPTEGITLDTNGRPGAGRLSKRTLESTASKPEPRPHEHSTHKTATITLQLMPCPPTPVWLMYALYLSLVQTHDPLMIVSATIVTISLIAMTLLTPPTDAADSITSGTVVQFIVYAEELADVTRVFPGANVDFTWNNVFVVSIWTNDAARLIPDIKDALKLHEVEIQTLVPPYTMAAATQKWLEYNLIWVCLLLFVFVAGCACGGVLLNKCTTIKHHQPQHHNRGCRTRC